MSQENSEISISQKHPVAYFCAEYGIQAELPLYAGGLGILAGDTLKEADDQRFPLIGIGLLYRGYRAKQMINPDGIPVDVDDLFDPLSRGLEHVYIDDTPLFIKVHMTEVDVWLRVWRKVLPNGLQLYLLDSETDQNHMTERSITQELYSGTNESQIKQQIILGVGGVKVLDALGVQPSIYHLNEGRPAFVIWQLIRQLMDRHSIDYDSAFELAKQRIVYTNHTLVAAGNKSYGLDQLKPLARYYAEKMQISVERLLETGQEGDGFSITRYALNVAKKANGVSALHTKLSQEQWPEYTWVAITNGVHLPTWQDTAIKQATDGPSLWQTHSQLKKQTAAFVSQRTGFSYNPEALVITWARRFAGYKQAMALFEDLDRLEKIVKETQRPVQILISGKAHQGDPVGKDVIRQIIQIMAKRLAGHALYVPDYSIEVAQQLVKGSDVWLNTPEFGREACGTSGMKALSNGVLQCTVADGWAAEVDWSSFGWVINHEKTAVSVYELLEQQIIPLFYKRENDLPNDWIEKMKKSIETAQHYSTNRMLHEYQEKLYTDF